MKSAIKIIGQNPYPVKQIVAVEELVLRTYCLTIRKGEAQIASRSAEGDTR